MKNSNKMITLGTFFCLTNVVFATDPLEVTVKLQIGDVSEPNVDIVLFHDQNLGNTTNLPIQLGGEYLVIGDNSIWGLNDGSTNAIPANFSEFTTRARGAVEIYDSNHTGLINFSSIKLQATVQSLSGDTHTQQQLNVSAYGVATTTDSSLLKFDSDQFSALPVGYYDALNNATVVSLTNEQIYNFATQEVGKSVVLPFAFIAQIDNATLASWNPDTFSGTSTLTITPSFTDVSQ